MAFNKEDMIDFFINDFDSVIGENIIDFVEDLERLDFIEINEPNGNFYYELDIDSEKTDALGQFIDYFDTVFFTDGYFMEYYTDNFYKIYTDRYVDDIMKYLSNLYSVYITNDFVFRNAELMYKFYTANKKDILEALFRQYYTRIVYEIGMIDTETP